LLAACDFDGDLARWRCERGRCDGGVDASVDAGVDAGANDAGVSDAGAGDAGADAGPTDAGGFQPDGSYNHVFVTSAQVSADTLGGAAAADALCVASAADAGLPGVYAAWTSELGEIAFDRTGMSRARGWLRVDGKPFADTTDDLSRGYIRYPLRLDERGNDLGSIEVLTGVRGTGEVAGNCGDFTGQAEMLTGCSGCGGPIWSDHYNAACSAPLHLICFGVDQNRALDPSAPRGPLIFIAAPWLPSGGLASADAWCNAQPAAADAGAPFVALLSTTGGSGASRLVSDAGWWRFDGVGVGDLRALPLDAPIELFDDGGIPVETDPIFSGSTNFHIAADLGSNCNDWLGWPDAGGHAVAGSALRPDNAWVSDGTTDCGAHPIYCVQP
jgi:hypothetical protein